MALPEKNRLMVEEGIRMVLKGLGEDVSREGLRDTPRRVAKMYNDVLDGHFIRLEDEMKKMTAFEEETYGGQVMVTKVPFYAFCEHHMALFHGKFGIAYIPNKKVLGLSKLVRIFRVACKKPTIQERITEEAVDLLMQASGGKGAICYVEAEHTCMTLRGVKSPGSMTSTIAFRGDYKEQIELRQQFLDLAKNGR